ncbi:MAG: glycosyltransferase family 4 protein [Patescibacteria group bacterium]
MKILITTGIYPPSIGGPATYSKILFEELPKRGIETTILSFDEVRSLPKIIRHAVYFLKIFGRSRGCGIIYAQDPVSVGLPSFFAAKILRKNFLLRVAGDYAWEQGIQRFGVVEMLDDFVKKLAGQYKLPVRFLRYIEYFVARHAERVIVPSKYLKKIVTGWGVPVEKITVINNAFEGVPREATSDRPKMLLSGKTIVSAGRLVPWKGFLVLVEMMLESVKKFPDLKLYIIGDGPDRELLERRIKLLELNRNVFLLGKVSQAALFDYVGQASAFVLNTGYEGFPHQILEALSLGTPVVTTDIGGNQDMMRHGENGFLVPYNDKQALAAAVEKILRDEELARRFKENGRVTVAKFTKERMINSLIKVME